MPAHFNHWFGTLPIYGQLLVFAPVMVAVFAFVLPAAYGRYDGKE